MTFFTEKSNFILLLSRSKKNHTFVLSEWKSSTDCEMINTKTAIRCIDAIVKPLTNIFVKSLNSGVFPYIMKTAKVFPIGVIFANYTTM